MQEPGKRDGPWDSEEAREVLRNYLRVVWRIHERLEKEAVDRMQTALPDTETSGTVNEQQGV